MMRSRGILVCFAVASLCSGAAVLCAARTLGVPGDYASIGAALAAAAAGDEIVLAPGEYAENLIITAGVVLRGGGPDPSSSTLAAADPGTPTADVSLLDAGEVRLENLRFVAAESGIGLAVDGAAEAAVRVVGCLFTVGVEAIGIAVQNGMAIVETSVFRGPDVTPQVPVQTAGILVGAGAAAVIRNCDFAYFADAVATTGGASLAVEASSVGYSLVGIAIRNQFSDLTAIGLISNQLYGCATGIFLSGSVSIATIQANTILDCSLAPLRATTGTCLGGGEPFSGAILGTGNVLPQLDLLCPEEGSGLWPEGFFG